MESVSASKRWFMVTKIPKDIQAPMTLFTGTSIIVESSFTVTNSVTLRIVLSFSCRACSSSVLWRWLSRFSLRYLAPLDLIDFPCSFSKVSRTCFCTSSSVGSAFMKGLLFPFLFLFFLLSLLLLRKSYFLFSFCFYPCCYWRRCYCHSFEH